MGKRVRLVDKAGNQSLSIDEDAFDDPERSLFKKSYRAMGFRIASYDDGSPYEGKGAARPSQVAQADNPAPAAAKAEAEGRKD